MAQHMKKNTLDSNKETFFQDLDVEFLIHELKDPIAVIETGARTLLEKQNKLGTLSPRQEKTVKRVIRNVRKAREMLYSLLEVGRSEAGSFACDRFNPVETIFDVLTNCLEIQDPELSEKIQQIPDLTQALAHLNTCGISLSASPDLFQMDMHQDEAKYRQIIGNLIKNALHFRRNHIDIEMLMDKEVLFIAVIDDGPGVEPGQCESIFQRYSQANECAITTRQGHGLGLAGARIMARCMGGDIELTCNNEEGTVFKLTMPMIFVSE